ncbi:MAG: hypothetical protein ACM3MG_13265 [Bacillota bacterium]
MSRYHGHIVFGVVFFLFISLIGMAELTKESPVAASPAPSVIANASVKNSGFNFAQVLIEQEVKSLSVKKLNKKEHQTLVLSQVKNLSKEDLMKLKTKALDRSAKWDERYICVNLLELTGIRAQKALQQIAHAPLSSSKGRAPASYSDKDKEKVLRRKAQEALSKMSSSKVAKTPATKNQRRMASASESRTLK